MTQVSVNGSTYSDDGSTEKDMQHGGHRTWLFPMIEDLMIVINGLLGGSFVASFQVVHPATGAILAAPSGLAAYVIEPLGSLAALHVILPPGPSDGQMFELSAGQTITDLTITAPLGAIVEGTSAGMLTGGGGLSWRFRVADNTWYRRF